MLSNFKHPYLAFTSAVISAFLIRCFFSRKFERGPKRNYNVDLSGQVIIITGCSAGIGKQTAIEMAKHNAVVIFACRDEEKTLRIIAQIKKETNNQNLFFMKLDLQDFDSVKEFSAKFHQKYNKLNMLINNAGIFLTKVQCDDEGHDLNFKTNHLGHFLLTNLLMDLIISTKQCRVINISSYAHILVKQKLSFDKLLRGQLNDLFASYSATKYCNILLTNQLQKLFDDKKIDARSVSINPGKVNTEIWNKTYRNIIYRVLLYPIAQIFLANSINEVDGAWTTNYTALQPYEELKPAGYYERNVLSQYSEEVKKFDQAQELWDFSLKYLSIKSII